MCCSLPDGTELLVLLMDAFLGDDLPSGLAFLAEGTCLPETAKTNVCLM